MKKDLKKILFASILTIAFVLAITACQSVKSTPVTMTSLTLTTSATETTKTTSTTTTVLSGVNSTSTISSNSLRLTLSLDSTTYEPGQSVTIAIDETNVLPSTNNIPASDKWPLSTLGVGPCGPMNYPFGIAIFKGNYTSSDILSATPLKLYNPTAMYDCPAILSGISAYEFQPSSDTAAIFQNSGSSPAMTESMNSEVQSTGYWVASPSETLTNFTPGIYTVVGGDQWGALVVAHFTVSATSVTTTTTSIVTSPTVTQNQQPVEIVSVIGPLQPFNPGGPVVEITLKNVSIEPVVSVTAVFTNLGPNNFDFNFPVGPSNPMLPGMSSSDSMTLINGNFSSDISYPLMVEGTFQNVTTFNYIRLIEITEPSN